MTKPPKKQRAKQPAGSGSVRIRTVLRDEIDLDKLAFALLRLARKQLDEGEKSDQS